MRVFDSISGRPTIGWEMVGARELERVLPVHNILAFVSFRLYVYTT